MAKLHKETIITPIITEKSIRLVDELNQYMFIVAPTATKTSVKTAVEEQFKVTVEKVRMVNRPGKRVAWGAKRISGKKKDTKRAIVTLKSGDSIDLFKVK